MQKYICIHLRGINLFMYKYLSLEITEKKTSLLVFEWVGLGKRETVLLSIRTLKFCTMCLLSTYKITKYKIQKKVSSEWKRKYRKSFNY